MTSRQASRFYSAFWGSERKGRQTAIEVTCVCCEVIQNCGEHQAVPPPCLPYSISSLFHHHHSGLTCPICYNHQSRTLSAEISFLLKVMMRIDEVMFVKDSCKHQRKGCVWISRAVVSGAEHYALSLYCLCLRPMTIALLPHPQPGCQL